MQEMRVRSLGREDLLEKEVAAHSSILAWEIPWTEEPGGLYSPWSCKRVRHDLMTKSYKIISRAADTATSNEGQGAWSE